MINRLGSYRVLEAVGGRAGDAYRARDTRSGRTVLLRPVPESFVADRRTRDRFLETMRSAAALSHPNIAAVFEVGEDSGCVFVASEFVQGDTLAALLDGRPLSVRRSLEIGIEVADALAAGHAAGIAHGAVSTDGIVVSRTGHAKLIDFGLSPWTDPRRGTAGNGTGDDLRALGRVIFEMLTGTPPAERLTPSAINASLPRNLDSVVMSAAGGRCDSAAALAADLRGLADALASRSDAPSSAPPMAVHSRRRARTGLLIAAGAAAAAGAIAWWLI